VGSAPFFIVLRFQGIEESTLTAQLRLLSRQALPDLNTKRSKKSRWLSMLPWFRGKWVQTDRAFFYWMEYSWAILKIFHPRSGWIIGRQSFRGMYGGFWNYNWRRIPMSFRLAASEIQGLELFRLDWFYRIIRREPIKSASDRNRNPAKPSLFKSKNGVQANEEPLGSEDMFGFGRLRSGTYDLDSICKPVRPKEDWIWDW